MAKHFDVGPRKTFSLITLTFMKRSGWSICDSRGANGNWLQWRWAFEGDQRHATDATQKLQLANKTFHQLIPIFLSLVISKFRVRPH